MNFSILEMVLFVFFSALCVTVLFRQLKLSVILGYLLVGAMVGPHGFAVIPETPDINELAEFGIVFLMFTIGLEFSLPKLLALPRSVYITGIFQITLSILVVTFIGKWLGMSTLSAIVVGSIAAMSSTAIAAKQLNDQLELYSPYGLNALGVLLLQDLAVVPLIILIAGLADKNHPALAWILTWALLKGIFAIIVIMTIGRRLLKPVFRLIAKTRAIELFTLAVLLVTLSAAWITSLLGLSFALGAFLAGMMLAETEFRHQIAIEIRPFRDILLGLFFITIGMLTDVRQWHHTWQWIIVLFLALTIGKMMLITMISRLSGNTTSIAIRTGLVLAQGGEFGFALLTLALDEHILSHEYSQVVLAALLLSIAVSPIIIRFNKSITRFLLLKSQYLDDSIVEENIFHAAEKLQHHVILCGYGRVGQHIARLLEKVNFPYIGLDLDVELVQKARLAGESVLYGDPTHPEILQAAQLSRAKVLMISFNDLRATLRILSIVRLKYPDLPILVRCRDDYELKQLKDQGATQVIAEIFEESLTLSHHLMQFINIAPEKITELMQEVRNQDYNLLKRVFTGTMDVDTRLDHEVPQLRPILITPHTAAVNLLIKDLELRKSGVEIVAMRRGDEKQFKPNGYVKILANDILIAYGMPSDLDLVEKKLLAPEE